MKGLTFEATVHVAKDKVWQLLGSESGIRNFLAPKANVEIVVGGPFEVLFDLSKPKGYQGSEGMQVLTVEPMERLGFTWNNPPDLPAIRDERTAVYIELYDVEEGTLLQLHHLGFGNGEDWDKSYDYFIRAWGQLVVPKLIYVSEEGPFPWGEEVDLTTYIDRIKVVKR